MSSDYCKPHLLLTVHSVGLVVSRRKHATMMSEEDWSSMRPVAVTGGTRLKYHFCRDKSFVAIKHVFCRDNSMLVATNTTNISRDKSFDKNILLRQKFSQKYFVATKLLSPRQFFCRDKSMLAGTKHLSQKNYILSRQNFVVTKLCLSPQKTKICLSPTFGTGGERRR